MKRTLSLLSALGIVLMAARPGTELNIVTQLNGQPTRFLLADGGPSGIFTTFDGGVLNSVGCMPLTGATTLGGTTVVPNVLMVVPATSMALCVRPSPSAPKWDGGCNLSPGDLNYGVPVQAGVPQYLTPSSTATQLCAASDAGQVQLPVWWME